MLGIIIVIISYKLHSTPHYNWIISVLIPDMISAIESATQLNSCQVKDNKNISLAEHNIFIALSLTNGRGESLSISRNDEHCTKETKTPDSNSY